MKRTELILMMKEEDKRFESKKARNFEPRKRNNKRNRHQEKRDFAAKINGFDNANFELDEF